MYFSRSLKSFPYYFFLLYFKRYIWEIFNDLKDYSWLYDTKIDSLSLFIAISGEFTYYII